MRAHNKLQRNAAFSHSDCQKQSLAIVKRTGLVLILLLFLEGCVSVDVTGYVVPGETLEKGGGYYIVPSKDDMHGLNELLKEGLLAKGLLATSGIQDNMPEDIHYIVEYGGQWQWDITWYLLNFNVRIYHSETKLLIASANSLRTSLGRKSPKFIVSETLGKLFKE